MDKKIIIIISVVSLFILGLIFFGISQLTQIPQGLSYEEKLYPLPYDWDIVPSSWEEIGKLQGTKTIEPGNIEKLSGKITLSEGVNLDNVYEDAV